MEVGYSRGRVAALELDLGTGFLSPGGPASLDWMLEGADFEGRTVLDFGCGPGGPACLLASKFGAQRVVGVDVGAYQVERAREAAMQQGLSDKMSFQQVDGGQLPFQADSFDAVFSKDVIVHIEDKAGLFADLFRILRPGGRLIVSDHLIAEDRRQIDAIQECWRAARMTAAPVTIDETDERLRACGFIEVRSIDRSQRYMEAASGGVPVDDKRADRISQLLGTDAAADWLRFMDDYLKLVAQGAVLFVHSYGTKPQ